MARKLLALFPARPRILGVTVRKITLLAVLALCLAAVSQADEIHLSTSCSVETDYPSCIGFQGFGSPTIDVRFGQLEAKLQGPSALESDITHPDFDSYFVSFTNGGGYFLLLDQLRNALAEGIFLPGAKSELHVERESFDASIQFFYLNADALGIGTGITQGFGTFKYSLDLALQPNATNFYDLVIDSNNPLTPTPEPGTVLLTLVGAGLFGALKLRR